MKNISYFDIASNIILNSKIVVSVADLAIFFTDLIVKLELFTYFIILFLNFPFKYGIILM